MSYIELDEIISSRDQLVKFIRKFGDVNTDGLLDKESKVFTIKDVDGFIGYKLVGSKAVVFGEPVCSLEDRPILAREFDADCQRKNLDIIYTMVSEEFVEWASNEFAAISIEFGTKFILDPHQPVNQESGPHAVLVRKKVKHALREGVVIKEYFGDDPTKENEMESLAKAWVEKRHGPQIYLCGVSLFDDRYGKRWFYADQNDKMVGLMVLNELQNKNGWLLNNIIISNEAPKGLSELLIMTALETLDKENCRYVLAGPVPLEELKTIIGISPMKKKLMRFIFKYISFFFHLGGHAKFWEKFEPECKSSFVLFPHGKLGPSTIVSLMKAFNVNKSSKFI